MSTIASPCVRHCCLDQNDICLGCFRSVQEIMGWSQATDIEKQRILTHTKERRAQANTHPPSFLNDR